MQNFTTWLVDARKSKNLSQAELAQKVGVSVRTISRLETGGRPNRNNLRKIADILGIFPEVLIAAVFQKGQLPPLPRGELEMILPAILSHRIRRLADKSGRTGEQFIEWLIDLEEQRDGHAARPHRANENVADVIHFEAPAPLKLHGQAAAHSAGPKRRSAPVARQHRK